MPTATDLVTDLPADFNVFGQGVDTSMQDLLGGTTGQILSKASNTNMDFTWITNDVGDITAVTAGTGISGGGTSGAVTITNSMATAIDAKGDLIGGTGADTFSRLAVGANNTVLTADSAEATGMKWATVSAGGMTSIASGSLSGGSLVLSSISGSYKNLQLVVRDLYTSVDTGITLTVNAITAYTNQRISTPTTTGGTLQTYTTLSDTGIPLHYDVFKSGDNNNFLVIDFTDYANTATNKIMQSQARYLNNSSIASYNQTFGSANSTAAITSITITLTSGTFSGGTYILYGVS